MRAKFTIRVSLAKKEPWKLFRTILKAENIPQDYLNLKNGISGNCHFVYKGTTVAMTMRTIPSSQHYKKHRAPHDLRCRYTVQPI